jgi:DNA polymerase delta subunit 1
MARVFDIAKDMSVGATALFTKPNKLEFEKVYYPYLLIGKKNYVGMKYEGTAAPKMDAKGIEIVRRDKIAVLRSTLSEILQLCLKQHYPEAATCLRGMIDKFVTNSLTVDDVETSKSLKAEYANDLQPQVQVVKKMKSRRAFGVPRVGDRVPFVIVEDASLPHMSMRAEHPDFVRRNRLKLDRLYYLDLVKTALVRVLKHVPIGNVEDMFAAARSHLVRESMGIRDVTSFFTVAANAPKSKRPLEDATVKDGVKDVVKARVFKDGSVSVAGPPPKKPKPAPKKKAAPNLGSLDFFLRK